MVEYPVLLPDGAVLTAPGFDPGSGLLYAPPGELRVEVPAAPTPADVRAAVAALADIVSDFPFETPAHRAAWVAALLTPLARFAFPGPSPLFLVDANVRGAGKGLLLHALARVVTGDSFTVATYTHDADELRKRITALALEGDRLVLFDNLEGKFGNATLDAALTGTSWKDRLLGHNRQVSVPLWASWYATGNNVAVGADTARRVCHVRLDFSVPDIAFSLRPASGRGNVRANARLGRSRWLSGVGEEPVYDPNPARFTSTDPIGFEAGDPNLYRYVANSPTNATDPSGLAGVNADGPPGQGAAGGAPSAPSGGFSTQLVVPARQAGNLVQHLYFETGIQLGTSQYDLDWDDPNPVFVRLILPASAQLDQRAHNRIASALRLMGMRESEIEQAMRALYRGSVGDRPPGYSDRYLFPDGADGPYVRGGPRPQDIRASLEAERRRLAAALAQDQRLFTALWETNTGTRLREEMLNQIAARVQRQRQRIGEIDQALAGPGPERVSLPSFGMEGHDALAAFAASPEGRFTAGLGVGFLLGALGPAVLVADLPYIIEEFVDPFGPLARARDRARREAFERLLQGDPATEGMVTGLAMGGFGWTVGGSWLLGQVPSRQRPPLVELPVAPAPPNRPVRIPVRPKPVPSEPNPLVQPGAVRSSPRGMGRQKGTLERATIDKYKDEMLDGSFYNNDLNKIDGYFNGLKLVVSDGHHRVQAALELYRETGNAYYLNELIRFSGRSYLVPSDIPGIAPSIIPGSLQDGSPPRWWIDGPFPPAGSP